MKEWLKYIEWAAPVGALVLLILNAEKLSKLLFSWFERVKNKMFGNAEIHKKMDDLTVHVQSIAQQLMPNGGTTIRDSLNRIESRQVLNEQRLRVLMSGTADALIEYDSLGQAVWVNWQYCRLTGRTPSEVLGYGWINTIHPEDRDVVREEWDRSIQEKRSFEMSYRKLAPDGAISQVQARSHVMLGSKNDVIGFVKVVTRMV